MELDLLRGELERLFSLEQLKALTRDVLGIAPEELGAQGAAAASFIEVLVPWCQQSQSVDALVDALVALRTDVDPRLREASAQGGASNCDELAPGTALGGFWVDRKLGEGPVALVYQAQWEGVEMALRVLRREVALDRRRVRRYLAHTRLVTSVKHSALPQSVFAGYVQDRPVVGYPYVQGHSLSMRLAHKGPMHVQEARPCLLQVLGALAALHERRLIHGNLKTENVLIAKPPQGQRGESESKVFVVDAGVDRLRGRVRAGDGLSMVFTPRVAAPELLRGQAADMRSDVYAFGVLLYEVLTGKVPFGGATPMETAVLHLTKEPAPPSIMSPHGWIPKTLDTFVLTLLQKEPDRRPDDAITLLEAFQTLLHTLSTGRSNRAPMPSFDDEVTAPIRMLISDEEVDARIDALLASPQDEEAILVLEAALEQGAEPAHVAEAFAAAAHRLSVERANTTKEMQKALLFRAARLFETSAQNPEKAESLYARLVKLNPDDELAARALNDVRKQLGKYEELIEMLIARVESSADPLERARALADIGQLYADELDDGAQALVAYTRAFCESPQTEEYVDEIERLAGADQTLWTEALVLITACMSTAPAHEVQTALYMQLGAWYSVKLAHPDLALPCYQSVLAIEPMHEGALEGICAIFRASQQWRELGTLLLRRADSASAPARAREFRFQAAQVLEQKLSEPLRAKAIYEQVLEGDPTHEGANEALVRIEEQRGDIEGLVKALDHWSNGLQGAEKARLLCRAAELFTEKLGEPTEAIKRYQSALAVDAHNPKALEGLDPLLVRARRYRELLSNLERQLAVATTPRQKVELLERIASLYEKEFLDHAAAAEAHEAIFAIDSRYEPSLIALERHYQALGRWNDVVAIYECHAQVTDDSSRRVEILLARGRALADYLGNFDQALEAYESALEFWPGHRDVLEALAQLHQKTGHVAAALHAIESLAITAKKPEDKAEQWLRAARLLRDQGDLEGAIERAKKAHDADLSYVPAATALREAYVEQGNILAAVELLGREIEGTQSPLAKARLYGEMARLLHEYSRDEVRAEHAAKRAIELDPSCIDGLLVLGDLAFDQERFLEASHYYEALTPRTKALSKDKATHVLVRYVDSLAKTGDNESVIASIKTLLSLAPDDREAIGHVARVTFHHAEPERAYVLNKHYVKRFGHRLDGQEKKDAFYRLGELARRLGRPDEAVVFLQEAVDMGPASPLVFEALAQAYADQGNWHEVLRVKNWHLDVAMDDEERSELLVDMGEIWATQLGDRVQGMQRFIAALEARPTDRKLLTRLLHLYSEEEDWEKLVDVILRLAEFVDDKAQKAKYFYTAANIAHKQIRHVDTALLYYDKALHLDPNLPRALEEALELRRKQGDWKSVEQLLHLQLERAQETNDPALLLQTFDALGELYYKHLKWLDEAIDAFEAAQTLDPKNPKRHERLARLYASNPAKYLAQAVAAQRALLRINPYRPEPYKVLRRLYTKAKQADSAWCLCQALCVLRFAESDEKQFFERMRADSAATPKQNLSDEDWALRLSPEEADPLVTAIFALLEPAVLAARTTPAELLGYDPQYALDLAAHPYPISRTLLYAAGILSVALPWTFANPNHPGGLSFLHAQTPSIVLGQAAITRDIPVQALAFLAARHLTYYRPGFYIRHLVPTGTGLKAWLFAAIKLVSSAFPITPELEGPVHENLTVLGSALEGAQLENLTSLVSKLLQNGQALDLKHWVVAIDLAADRAGLLLANDLEAALELIKASDEGQSALPIRERITELILFSVSEEYFELRKSLGITIDALGAHTLEQSPVLWTGDCSK